MNHLQEALIKDLGRVIQGGLSKLTNLDFLEDYKSNEDLPNFLAWSASTLAQGLPGVLVLFANAGEWFSEEEQEKLLEQLIRRIYHHVSAGVANLSLFAGLTGIAFAIAVASRRKKYEPILVKLDKALTGQLDAFLLGGNLEKLHASFFDVVSGISGIGRYLLLRVEEGGNDSLRPHLIKILKKIQEIQDTKQGKYSWRIPMESQFLEIEKTHYPFGNYNLGLAHGVLGPFSLFDTCLRDSITVDRHRETLLSMGNYLREFILLDSEGEPYWPPRCRAGFRGEKAESPKICWNGRDGWCYGNASCSLILWKIGSSLEESEFKKLAIQLVRGSLRHPHLLDTPSICHGLAGYLQILITLFSLVEKEEPDLAEELLDKIKELAMEIVALYSSEHIFGFKDIEHHQEGTYILDDPGLLTGTSGILCVLINTLQVLQGKVPELQWCKAFLLN
ncbi:MAG: lanthionine synthetase C family protein [Neisseriaceae bacterium]